MKDKGISTRPASEAAIRAYARDLRRKDPHLSRGEALTEARKDDAQRVLLCKGERPVEHTGSGEGVRWI